MLAYVVGAVFISVYSISADTILQCFLVDLDISQQQGREEAHHRPEALEGFIYMVTKEPSPSSPEQTSPKNNALEQ